MTPRLSLRGITKRYPGITANDRISLDAMPGEVLAVLGENGAGKSTLMRIIYGATRPDEGEIEFDGMPFDVDSPAQARARGVAMVHQHFALFDTLTAAENVLLGQTKPMTVAEVSSEIERLGRQYGLEVDPSAVVMELSMGERQRIEIIRALMTNPKLLILDEPTSVLTPQAVAKLFKTLHQLAAEGVTILFISHKLDEIRELADRCAVLRAGRIVASVNPKKETEASLARLMIGGDPPAIREAGGDKSSVTGGTKVLSDRISYKDYKTELQEFLQKRRGKVPRYFLVSQTGPDHDQVFSVSVELGTKVFGPAEGKNKKSAEQAAAKLALIALGIEKG